MFGLGVSKDASPLAQSWMDVPQCVYVCMWAAAWSVEKGLGELNYPQT